MTTPEKDEVREDQAVDDAVKTETEAEQSSSASDTEDTKAAETNQDSKDSKESEAEDPIEAAKKEAAAWQDKYLRLHAEWDTYRRRMNEQREEEKARAAEKLVESLIPVIDDFERSIDYAEKNGETGLLGGVQAVHTKMLEVLSKQGVEMIDPKGEAFNALEALAVATVDDPSVPDETVADVYQKGYRMGNKVIRSAMVTVTQGGPKREIEDDESKDSDTKTES